VRQHLLGSLSLSVGAETLDYLHHKRDEMIQQAAEHFTEHRKTNATTTCNYIAFNVQTNLDQGLLHGVLGRGNLLDRTGTEEPDSRGRPYTEAMVHVTVRG